MSKGLTFWMICAVAIASGGSASGQQSNQTESAFATRRAEEKARVKKVDALTWKMKVQESKKGAGSWNKTQELRAGKWAPTDHKFETPKAPSRRLRSNQIRSAG